MNVLGVSALLGILVALCTLVGFIIKLTSVIVGVKVLVEEYVLKKLEELQAQIDRQEEREYDNAIRNPPRRGR